MKFVIYLKALTKLAEKHPEILDYDVITSSDDEGNWFQKISHAPSIGYFNNGEFFPDGDDIEELPNNAVCLN